MQGDAVLSPDEAHEAAAEVVAFINEQTGPSCEAWLTPHGWTLLDLDSSTRTDFTYDPESAQWHAHIWFLTAEKPLKVDAIGDLDRLKAEVVATHPSDVLAPVRPVEVDLGAVTGVPLADYALETADRARAQHDSASLAALAPHPLTIFYFSTVTPNLSIRGECDSIPFSAIVRLGSNDEGDYIATTAVVGDAVTQEALLHGWPHYREGERASDNAIATYLLPLIYNRIAHYNHAHPCSSHEGPPAAGPNVGEAAHRPEPHPHIPSLARCRTCACLLPGNPG